FGGEWIGLKWREAWGSVDGTHTPGSSPSRPRTALKRPGLASPISASVAPPQPVTTVGRRGARRWNVILVLVVILVLGPACGSHQNNNTGPGDLPPHGQCGVADDDRARSRADLPMVGLPLCATGSSDACAC